MQIEITAARVQAASGKAKAPSAIAALNSVIQQTANYGFVGYGFDARLALAEIEMKSGQAPAARAHLESLEKDTNAKPTGGTRQIQYKLKAGEAGWVLKPVRIDHF